MVESSASLLEGVSNKVLSYTQEGDANLPLLPGGKHFSKNLTPLDADGNPVGMWGVSSSHRS